MSLLEVKNLSVAWAGQVADRVCVMEQGRIVEQGATATVVAHPQSLAARRLLAVDFFRMARS